MKKKLSLMLVALLSMAAIAATTWKVTADTPVAAGSTLIDDDVVTVKTVFATTLKDDVRSFADNDFTHYIQVRNAAYPTSAVPEGTEQSGSTSLIVTAKKNAKATFYYRRQPANNAYAVNDGKDMVVFDQTAGANITECILTKCAETEDAKYAWVTKTAELKAGQSYTLSAKGTTIQFYGITYEEDTAVDQFLFNEMDPETTKYSDRTHTDGNLTEEVVLSDKQGVTMTLSPSTSTTPNCFYLDNSFGIQLRVFEGAKMLFEAPEGKMIQKISFQTNNWSSVNTAAPGILDLKEWTGESRKVTVNIGAKSLLNAIKVTLTDKKDFSQKVEEALAAVEAGETAIMTMYDDYELDKAISIPAGKQLVIDGDGNTLTAGAETGITIEDGFTLKNVKVDASALKVPLIAFAKEPTIAAVESGQYVIKNPITIEGVEVKGLTKNLISDNGKDYAYTSLNISNSVFQYATQADIVFNFAKSMAINFNILNSTFYSTEAGTANFIAMSGKRPWQITGYENETGLLTVANSTFYNVAKGKQFMNTNTLKGQKYLYEFNSNIFADVSNKKIYGNMTNNKKQLTTDGKNTYVFDGAFFNETNYNGDEGLKTNPTFADAAAGDFTIHAGSLQAKNATGDPRWLVAYDADVAIPVDVEADVATGAELSAAVAQAQSTVDKAGVVTVNLDKDGQYTITGSITTAAGIIINGNGSTIDASGLGSNMIAMDATAPADWTKAVFTLKDATVKGLKKALFYSAAKNYLFQDFTVDNSVIEQAGDATTFDFTKGSTAVNFTVTNSTIYAPTATTKSLYSSQGGQKTTEAGGDLVQTFTIKNSTLYNLAPGKNFFTHRQNSQKWLTYDVQNNIFVNCGKSGQTIKGLNGGGSSANPTWTVKGNTFNFDGEDTSAAEATGDDSEPVQDNVAGVVAFADVEKGDFTLAYKSAQNEAKIGDPRWIVVPEDVKVEMASGDISEALDEALAKVKVVKDIRINLTNGGEYTISKSIVVPNSLYIVTGDIMAWEQQNATIDASGLEGPMITTPAEAPGEWVKGQILVDDVTVKGLKKALFASAAKNHYYEQFSIWGSVIEVAADVTTLDFTKGSVASLMISSSTIYAPTATTKAFYSSQSGQKATEYAEDAQQAFIIFGSTMYNLAKGKNFFTHRQANQTWLTYNLQNNIFVNCGKSGQVVKGVNAGQSGKNPKWMIVSNLFNYDGKDTSAEESTGDADETVEKSIPGVVTFADAAAGDFNATVTLAEGAEKPAGAGDGYHWKITYSEATAIEAVKTAEGADLENAVIYNLNGQRIDKAQAKSGVFIVNGKKVVIK